MTRPGERMVTLHDGRQVSNWSESWRHETEAMHILNLPSLAARRAALYGVRESTRQPGNKWFTRITTKGILQHRGEDEVKRIEATMVSLWKKRKALNDNIEAMRNATA